MTASKMSLSPLPKRGIDAAQLIATWFGCGYVPVGPGTAGSLAALAIAVVLHVSYGAGRGTFLLLTVTLLLPGMKLNTSPTNYNPIRQMQLARFTGESWELFGGLIEV